MATISMSTNSASTSNNGGTGNKQLRASMVTLQNDIDLADAILQNSGTALAANDIIEAIAVPANTLILHSGFKVVTAMTGTTSDSALHIGITGTDVDSLLPIPVFFDPKTNKILKGSVPADLREELDGEII